MNKKKFLYIIFILISLHVQADELWQKAQKIAAENYNLVPGEIHKEKTVFKKNNKVKSYKELTIRTSLNDTILVELVNARADKKKLTESSSYVKDELQKDYRPKNESVFYNNESFQVKVQPTRTSEFINDLICSVYLIEYTTIENEKPVKYTGRLWLDAENGTPYKLEKTCDKLPIGFKSFKEITEYSIDDKQRWIKVSETTITETSILFVKLKMELKYTFSNYWKYPNDLIIKEK